MWHPNDERLGCRVLLSWNRSLRLKFDKGEVIHGYVLNTVTIIGSPVVTRYAPLSSSGPSVLRVTKVVFRSC